MNKGLKFGLDMAPLLVFFVGFKLVNLQTATVWLMIATLISIAIIYYYERKIALMPLVTALIVSIFGGLTLYFNNEIFIKIKPTIINLIFAVLLLGGLAMKRPLLRYVLSDAVTLTEQGWRRLSLYWGLFFLVLAALNELVWRTMPTDFWVNFKVFGLLGLTFAFAFVQALVIGKYIDNSRTREPEDSK